MLAIEDMKAHIIVCLFLFSLLLFAADSIEAARKDPGEYWVSVMKDQPMPEAVQGLLPLDSSSSQSNKNDNNCHTSMGARNKPQFRSPFMNYFKPRRNYVEYSSKDDAGHETEKKYVWDFESRPNLVEYSKDDVGREMEKKLVRDIDLKPNDDDNEDGPKVQRLYAEEFETAVLDHAAIYHE